MIEFVIWCGACFIVYILYHIHQVLERIAIALEASETEETK